MARSPLMLALAAGLLVLLTTLHLLYGQDLKNFAFRPWQAGLGQSLEPPVLKNGSSNFKSNQDDVHYLLGVGKADITGPVVEINFMGYANASQVGSGLRQRLYSRAFIVANVEKPEERFVYIVLDTQSGDTAIRNGTLEALQSLGDEYALYGNQNVALTGTHSHSGPGAWLNYLLPQITSKGVYKPSYQAIVDGTVASIVQAHENLAPGRLSVGRIDVTDANINRSPYAYLANPEKERQRYQHDVDKTMTALRFTHVTDDGEGDVGVLTWFPVHGTSMYGNNTIVTGDNKGVAAWLVEQTVNAPNFVAGFSQANVGDTSPNINGAFCEYGSQAGEQCDFKTSLCGERSEPCHGRGPHWGLDDGGTASTYAIGQRQSEAVLRLLSDTTAWAAVPASAVRAVHHFVDLSNYYFALSNGTMVHTCPAALGYSFAAGTTDGPGAFDFKQGQPNDPHASPLWARVRSLVHTPNATQEACHAEKVILLDVGESHQPYEWTPNIVDVQLLRVGQLFIIVSPGEATTMAGRRWREALYTQAATLLAVESNNSSIVKGEAVEPVVVLGGPANSYTHYITTREEYAVQRYEGASTLYGPWTLDAYINLTLLYLPGLSASPSAQRPGAKLGPLPPIQIDGSLSFISPVVVDRPPWFKKFGDVVTNVQPRYTVGQTISATFVAANPRNNYRLGGTFAVVERYNKSSESWERIRDDSDWSLLFEWKRTSEVTGTSEARISWETKWEAFRDDGSEAQQDLIRRDGLGRLDSYRLRYYGDAKALSGSITAFEGVSGAFTVV